jgi:Ecdysteroid kinase-like family
VASGEVLQRHRLLGLREGMTNIRQFFCDSEIVRSSLEAATSYKYYRYLALLLVITTGTIGRDVVPTPPHHIVKNHMLPEERAIELLKKCLPKIPTLDQDIVQDVVSRKRKLTISKICRLWAGMGFIYKISIDDSEVLVVKHVAPPSSGEQSFGDQRKSHSYQVEANFYEHVAPEVSSIVEMPIPFFVERGPGNKEITVCMSMLHGSWIETSSAPDVHGTLRWLAHFHASYWGDDAISELLKKANLQKTGSYWHLDTRPEEHEGMSNRGLQGRLKRAARAIDECLKRDPMQCLIHGDPKEANVMRLENGSGSRIAMYDFQYCGKGTPTRDLAYFLCSSCPAAQESELVNYYYEQLTNELLRQGNKTPPDLQHFQKSLELAFCDFDRFLCGWGQWGYDLKNKTVATLQRIDGGMDLGSENAYRQAVQAEFW